MEDKKIKKQWSRKIILHANCLILTSTTRSYDQRVFSDVSGSTYTFIPHRLIFGKNNNLYSELAAKIYIFRQRQLLELCNKRRTLHPNTNSQVFARCCHGKWKYHRIKWTSTWKCNSVSRLMHQNTFLPSVSLQACIQKSST